MRWWCGSLFCLLVAACDDTRPLVSDIDVEAEGGSAGEAPLRSCEPGETRCHGQLAFQSCTPSGEWGSAQTCAGYSEDGTSSYCAWVTSGAQRWAACVDPACAWWLASGLLESDRGGVCLAGGAFRACGASGVLGPSAPCDGECHEVGRIDGRRLGYCVAVCKDGERECVAGPLYRECVKGAWSEPLSCDPGAPCQPLAEGALLGVRCGGECTEGTSRCSSDRTSVEPCGGASEPCKKGQCVQSGAVAQCQQECEPGERRCAFDGDGVERVCSPSGLWLAPRACEGAASCRVGSSGVTLGCVECAPGDSRCTDLGVGTCENGSFTDATPCPAGSACVDIKLGARPLAFCE